MCNINTLRALKKQITFFQKLITGWANWINWEQLLALLPTMECREKPILMEHRKYFL